MKNVPRWIGLVVFALPACGTLTYYAEVDTDDTASDPSSTPDDDPDPGEIPPTEDCPEPDCDDPDCAALCDLDGDGVVSVTLGGEDCDDTDDTVYPGASEVCDQRDNDCDEEVDGDGDGDGAAVCDDCDDTDPTRHPGVADPCGDGVDSDCDATDCIFWTEGFEAGLGAPFAGGGAVPWTVSGISPWQGVSSAVSGDVGDREASHLTLTVDYPAGGTVSFWHSGSTESGYDFLKFSIDGVERDRWSGTWAWTSALYLVPNGVHTFQWTYDKDQAASRGQDSVLLDDVALEGATP